MGENNQIFDHRNHLLGSGGRDIFLKICKVLYHYNQTSSFRKLADYKIDGPNLIKRYFTSLYNLRLGRVSKHRNAIRVGVLNVVSLTGRCTIGIGEVTIHKKLNSLLLAPEMLGLDLPKFIGYSQ